MAVFKGNFAFSFAETHYSTWRFQAKKAENRRLFMKRDAEKSMLTWYGGRHRKPLVLRGARQVGKSTLVRQFAASNGLSLQEINLERHRSLRRSFASMDLRRIADDLEVILERRLGEPGSLLFLDEIQEVPEALAALRYFYEERPDMAVVSAGSLLEFALTRERLAMPVGRVSYMHLGPMSFAEFLEAVAPALLPFCRRAACGEAIPEQAHLRLVRLVRQFMFVGGMPEAITRYVEEGLSAVPEIHGMLLESYEDDFAKYARNADLALMQEVFRNLAPMSCKKAKYVNFSRDASSREVKGILELLRKAQICAAVRASKCDGLPLFADTEEGVWKPLFLDVGLMNHVCGIDWPMLERLDDIRFVNEGTMAEQFVGQHLLYRCGGQEKPQLAYWLREGAQGNAEVDFVVSSGEAIYPIEVRAGLSGSLKSLREMIIRKGLKKAFRFDLNPPSRQRVELAADGRVLAYELVSLPLYAAPFAAEAFATERGRDGGTAPTS